MKPWETLNRQTILDKGFFLKIEEHAVKLPDGTVIPDWPWIVTPDYVNVVVVTQSGKFVCFRQTKYAVDGSSLAVVGGYIEPGEDPLVAAQREVLEETGYVADSWTFLGKYAVDGNRGAGTAHLFLATDAWLAATPNADDLEEQTLLHLSQEEIESAMVQGNFRVLAWATAVALALFKLQAV